MLAISLATVLMATNSGLVTASMENWAQPGRRQIGVLDADRTPAGTVTVVFNAACEDGRYLLSIRNHPRRAPTVLAASVNNRQANNMPIVHRLTDMLPNARSVYLHNVACDPSGGVRFEVRGTFGPEHPLAGGEFSEPFYWRL